MKYIVMKIYGQILALAAFAGLVAGCGVTGGDKLRNENKNLKEQVAALQAQLDEAIAERHAADSLADEILSVYEENEDKNYTQEEMDSLLNLWYLHRQSGSTESLLAAETEKFSSNVPDSVFIKRLASINSFITLPYNETVRNYMIMYAEKMPSRMASMLSLAEYYFPIIEETLDAYNMPLELKYMAIIESALNPTAVSRVRAKGMWQFMYSTARSYGLKINSYVDERFDPVKSVDAAARYMKDAYDIFGDWSLAISAYNCGFGNVSKAIRRAGKSDFWSIYPYLPRETRGYMPAFVGAMYAFNFYKEHGIRPEASPLPPHVDTFYIKKNLHFKQITEVVGVPEDDLRNLNPQYIKEIIPGNEGTSILRIPSKFSSSFIEYEDSVYRYKAAEIFSPATLSDIHDGASRDYERVVYKVKSGDYLGKIASKYHVTVAQIKKWNGLRSNNLRVGQRLEIYPGGRGPVKSTSEKKATVSTEKKKDTAGSATTSGEYTIYKVKSGDTLSKIASNYPGISAKNIMDFNGMKNSKISVGQKLKIPRK